MTCNWEEEHEFKNYEQKKWENKKDCYSQIFWNWFEFVYEKRHIIQLRRMKSRSKKYIYRMRCVW